MMGHKLKITGWVAAGAVAGVLTTVSLQTVARGSLAPLPLEELQQLAAVFGMVKSDYVEPVDEKKLISDAISGMAEFAVEKALSNEPTPSVPDFRSLMLR